MFVNRQNQGYQERNKSYCNYSYSEWDNTSVFLSKASSEEDIFYGRYLMNLQNQILYVQIIDIQLIPPSFNADSYMVYVIKILTQHFGYQIRRRYSEFLALYSRLTRNKYKNEINFTFPRKDFSSSLATIFGSRKQKIAEQRRGSLNTFLNEIKMNYEIEPKKHENDFVELLKFLKIKQQSENKQVLKEGKFPQLSNFNSKSSLENRALSKKSAKPSTEYLHELLEHELNKLNLKNVSVNPKGEKVQRLNEKSIKIISTIEEIVLELKKNITCNQIRLILVGNRFQTGRINDGKEPKLGLVQLALGIYTNELISIKILKTLIHTFMNPEVSYSSDLFRKVMPELSEKLLKLNQFNELAILTNEFKEFRFYYFNLVSIYLEEKIHCLEKDGIYLNGNILEMSKIQSKLVRIIMDRELREYFEEWKLAKLELKANRNTDAFKGLDQGKDKVEFFLKIEEEKPSNKQQLKEIIQNNPSLKVIKEIREQSLEMVLETEQNEASSIYSLNCKVLDPNCFPEVINIFLAQKQWNPLLESESIDQFSNTKKQNYQFPGKQSKNFRFVEHSTFGVDLESEEEQEYVLEDNTEILNLNTNEQQEQGNKGSKASSLTVPSESGSNAHFFNPNSQLQYRKVRIVKEPIQGYGNTFNQSISVNIANKKVKKDLRPECDIKIEFIFWQAGARKYFHSQLSGDTTFIFDNIHAVVGRITE